MNLQFSALSCFILLTAFVSNAEESDCNFPKHKTENTKRGESQIEVLKGQRLVANDMNYTYYIGICVTALDPPPEGKEGWDNVAVIQEDKHDSSQMKAIGRFSAADIMAGPDWVLLEYNGGDQYGSHCLGEDGKGEERRARIMFICDETALNEVAIVKEEQNNTMDACYYSFEISTAAVCKKQPFVTVGLSGCTFPKHKTENTKRGESQIEVLKGQRLVADHMNYTYYIGICVTALDPLPEGNEGWDDVAVIQIDKHDPSKLKAIGRFSAVDIMAGPDWVLLEYNRGDQYGSHCLGEDGKGEERRARIMFICDESVSEEVAIVIEEQNNKTDACYYLFEISTAAVCKKQPFVTVGLSAGSVLLIVFFCLVAVYLLGGCLYVGFVLKSKAVDQIPNLSFWRDFGNLQACGCDLVCKSHKSREPRTYKGIGDDPLGDRDLLPM